MEEEQGGGWSWNDMNEPFMSFEEFKAKGIIPAIMKSDGGIINKLE